MDKKLEDALRKVEMTYSDIVQIANDMLKPVIEPANVLVNEVASNANNLTIDQIRDYILRLQLTAFTLSEVKEKSAMKAELADAIHTEAYAVRFNSLEGSVESKKNTALISIAEETLTTVLYNLTSNLLKTKLDQLHRLVDSLKSILMSRMQETKFMNIGAADTDASYKTRIQLNEEAERGF